jgi:outer membrane lipoprotein SlyB
MSNKSVFCIATNRVQAEEIVDRLKSTGFSANDISVLFPDKETNRDFAHEKNTKAPEGAVTGAGTGGVVGGALGWLVGIGALAIPGVGPFIAAGPIMAALSGAAIGAAAGGIAGGLIGLGIPELEAKRYEAKIKSGNILISVHTEDSTEIKQAKEIFTQANAQDICSTGESSAPNESKAEPHATPELRR